MYYVVDAQTGEIVQYLTRPLPPARPRGWAWAWGDWIARVFKTGSENA